MLLERKRWCSAPAQQGYIKNAYTMETFILVDQTTYFPQEVRDNIERNAMNLIKPGMIVHVMGFSTYSDKHYTSHTLTERVSRELNDGETYNLSVKGVEQYKKCIQAKQPFLRAKVLESIRGLYREKNEVVLRSDILWALQNISKNAIAPSPHGAKIVLIASDLLENSSFGTFYAGGTLRKIDPDAEMAKVKKERLLGGFGNSFVFVIGAGLVEEGKGAHRDHRTLSSLRGFWEEYFKESNGKLVSMGMPVLERMIGE